VYINGRTGLRHEHIGSDKRIIFCLGDSGGPFDRRGGEVYEQSTPLTALAALRPGLDIAIVPSGEEEVEVAGFYQQTLNLEPWQVQHAPGNFCTLETSVCGDMEEELRNLAAAMPSMLVPSYRHDAADWLAERLGLPVCGDTWQWRRQYGKVSLHRHVNEHKRMFTSLDELSLFRTPRGYVADTSAELSEAFKRLIADGVTRLMLKPAYSDTGEGIIYLNGRDKRKVENYEFTLGPVIIEERIAVAFDLNLGGPISPSIHWAGFATGAPTSQVVENGEYFGTCYPAGLSEKLHRQAVDMVKAYVRYATPKGLGGLDFVCGEDENLYLCDVNNGRCTEAIPPLLFASQYTNPDIPHILLARKYIPDCSIWAIWERLQANGIAWQPQQKETGFGVFPFMHLDSKAGMLIACAPTVFEAKEMLRRAVQTM
jgi:hypothetical protein